MRIKNLIEVSTVSKTCYLAVRKNKLFVQKLSDFRKLFNNQRLVLDYYYDACLSFSNDLFVYLKKYVCEDKLESVRDLMTKETYYSFLPFRIWNHVSLCERSQYVKDIYLDCTKLYIQNKRISNFINDELCLNISEFPYEITRGIASANKIYFFAHTNAYYRKNDPFGTNLGSLYYESVNSPFLLWKFYLDVLSRVVFNQTNKYVLLMLLSDNETDCRKFTVCNEKNCSGMRKVRIKIIFYKELVSSCKRLCQLSCYTIEPFLVTYAFKNYKRGVDFFSPYLEIER